MVGQKTQNDGYLVKEYNLRAPLRQCVTYICDLPDWLMKLSLVTMDLIRVCRILDFRLSQHTVFSLFEVPIRLMEVFLLLSPLPIILARCVDLGMEDFCA